MLDLIRELFPIYRTLNSAGQNVALEIIQRYLPLKVECFWTGGKVWDWTIPQRYSISYARLEDEDGVCYMDFDYNPLGVVCYSNPVDEIMSFDELDLHLHVSDIGRPYKFSFYEEDWGFCLTKELYDLMPRGKKYRAVIDSTFEQGFLSIGSFSIGAGDEFMVMAHTDHPYQANDGISGVAVAVELAKRFQENPVLMKVTFLFAPETIGSIAFFSNRQTVEKPKAGIFLDMLGNDAPLVFHFTENEIINDIGLEVFGRVSPLFSEPCNDDKVLNIAGVPCAAVNRYPYKEYHTDRDTPDILSEEKLLEAADKVEDFIRMYASNFIPKKDFIGPPFLSGRGMYTPETERLCRYWDGKRSVLEMAKLSGVPFWTAHKIMTELTHELATA